MKKILCILLIFSIIQNRKLLKLEEDEVLKICKRCISNFNFTYKDYELLNNISTNDKNNSYVKKLAKILQTDFNSSQLIKEYVYPRIIIPNIIYIILILILFIIWAIFIYRVCQNKKYFKFKSSDISNTHFKYYLIFYITIFFL